MSQCQFTEDGVTALNNKLGDLNVAGTFSSFGVVDSIENTPMSLDALSTSRSLFEALRYYDTTLLPLSDHPTKEEILSALAPRHHSLTTASSSLHIVDYLCTHLQAERLFHLNKKNTESSSEGKESEGARVDTSRGLTLFQLDRICKDMQVTGLDLVSMEERDIVTALVCHMKEVMAKLPPGIFDDPPTILQEGEGLSVQQEQLVQRINTAFVKDFTVRRRMLLKRLDVTIQSFLWGASVQGKEDEILAVINAQRQHLTEVPASYSLKDALTAPVSLVYEHTKKVTGGHSRGENSNLVKKVIIGHVPDRGGRPLSEDRAKALVAKQNRWGGGGGNGGGGNGGGGKGKGGGGRGHNHNSNSNKNNSNNNARKENSNKRGGGGEGEKGNPAAKKGKV